MLTRPFNSEGYEDLLQLFAQMENAGTNIRKTQSQSETSIFLLFWNGQ